MRLHSLLAGGGQHGGFDKTVTCAPETLEDFSWNRGPFRLIPEPTAQAVLDISKFRCTNFFSYPRAQPNVWFFPSER